jgi:hypothetical protein
MVKYNLRECKHLSTKITGQNLTEFLSDLCAQSKKYLEQPNKIIGLELKPKSKSKPKIEPIFLKEEWENYIGQRSDPFYIPIPVPNFEFEIDLNSNSDSEIDSEPTSDLDDSDIVDSEPEDYVNDYDINADFEYDSDGESSNSSNPDTNYDFTPIDFVIEPPTKPINTSAITTYELNKVIKKKKKYKPDVHGCCLQLISLFSNKNKQNYVDLLSKLDSDPIFSPNLVSGFLMYKGDVYKKDKDPKTPKSFRLIIELPTHLYLYNKIQAYRLSQFIINNKYLDTNILKGTSTNKYSCLEQYIKVKSVVSNAIKTSNALCVVALDISGAFSSLNRDALCSLMFEYSIAPEFIAYIKKFYDSLEYETRTLHWKSNRSKLKNGLIEGCPLSSFLFQFVMNHVLKQISHKYKSECGYKLENTQVFLTAYVDDILITCSNPDKLPYIILDLMHVLKPYGLLFNIDKSKLMTINIPNFVKPPALNSIQITDKITFLGNTIRADGKTLEQFNRIEKSIKNVMRVFDLTSHHLGEKKSRFEQRCLPRITDLTYFIFDEKIAKKQRIVDEINFVYGYNWNKDYTFEQVFLPIEKTLYTSTDSVIQALVVKKDKKIE